jgi:hypothetical protein
MLLDILKILINFFYGERLPQDETLLKMKSLLQLYASDSEALISRYLLERHAEQKGVRNGDFALGSVTVRCQRLSHHLRVEILNARQLKPSDPQAGKANAWHGGHRVSQVHCNITTRLVRISSKPLSIAASRRRRSSANLSRSARNLDWVKSTFASINSNLHEAGLQLHHATSAGSCHPYVSLRIVPETAFPAMPKFRTKTHKRTLFPLFDETFDLYGKHTYAILMPNILMSLCLFSILSPSVANSLHDGYLQMRDVPVSDDGTKRLADLPQIQIPLTKPTHQGRSI